MNTLFRKSFGLMSITAAVATLLAGGMHHHLRADQPEPIRVLYVTGGGWHDYKTQEKLLTDGLKKRLNVEITVDHEGGTDAGHKLTRLVKNNWHEDFDVVIYNMCYSNVEDKEYVERIAKVHHEHGIPAIFMHCAIHTYRRATGEWWKLGGLRSHRHEGHRPFTVKSLESEHPIMRGFPKEWTTPNGELYEIAEIYDNTTPLAKAYGRDTEKDHVVIWTNQYGKARVFGTTVGHHNETVADDVFLDLMARGTLWAVDKLADDGKPVAGYGVTAQTGAGSNE